MDYSTWSTNTAKELVALANEAADLRGNNKPQNFSKNAGSINSIIEKIRQKTPPQKYLPSHMILYSMSNNLSFIAERSKNGEDYYSQLEYFSRLLNLWKKEVNQFKDFKPSEIKQIDLSLKSAVPKKSEQEEEKEPKLRGVAIISFTTVPKPISYKEEEDMHYYQQTDLMSVTVEVENQGEAVEHDLLVELLLKSSISGTIMEATQTIDTIKPGERKPVTFSNLLPDPNPDAEQLIKVVVNPVPEESYIFNNEKYWHFQWKTD